MNLSRSTDEIKLVPEMTGGRVPYTPRNHRRILCIFPRYSRSLVRFTTPTPSWARCAPLCPPKGFYW